MCFHQVKSNMERQVTRPNVQHHLPKNSLPKKARLDIVRLTSTTRAGSSTTPVESFTLGAALVPEPNVDQQIHAQHNCIRHSTFVHTPLSSGKLMKDDFYFQSFKESVDRQQREGEYRQQQEAMLPRHLRNSRLF